MEPMTLAPSSLVSVTDVSVPPMTDARIGAIGLTPAAPEAGVRVTVAGGAGAELAELREGPEDVAELTGPGDVVVGCDDVARRPEADVQAASARIAAVAAATHRAPAATAPSEATTAHADGAGRLIVAIRSAFWAQRHITIGSH